MVERNYTPLNEIYKIMFDVNCPGKVKDRELLKSGGIWVYSIVQMHQIDQLNIILVKI